MLSPVKTRIHEWGEYASPLIKQVPKKETGGMAESTHDIFMGAWVAMMRQRDKHFSSKEKVYGQFFTPQVVADFIVALASRLLDRGERGIDPACGDGVFLKSMLDKGFREVWGIDIDPNVLKVIPEYIGRRARIIIGDALIRSGIDATGVPEGYFDLAVGNPPFSSKYGRIRDSRLRFYTLGRGRSSQAIEVLFLERFLQLVRPGGIVGIILPDGILSGKSLRYVREFILENYRLLAVVSLPRGIFHSSIGTTSKTSILVIKREKPLDGQRTLMLEIRDTTELNVSKDNIEEVFGKGFYTTVEPEELTPIFYKPLNIKFREDLPIKTLGELVEEVRVGATEYGEKRRFTDRGLKFISARVVTPLGLDYARDGRMIEPGTPMDKKRAHVKPGDLLFVRVGVGCSGRAAVAVDEEDAGVADDWIYIIRLKNRDLLPYYIAVYMQSKPGKLQIDKMKRGVGPVNIPKTELLKLKIPIPTNEFLELVKAKYIKMISHLRKGDKRDTTELFKELISLVENTVLESTS